MMSRSTLAPHKRSKKNSSTDDELSNLPEDVISHILSLMPTKDAVRTCVLSRYWEYRWTSIYNVNIADKLFQNQHHGNFVRKNSTRALFVNFVERIVLLSRNITSFVILMCCEYEWSRIRAWICSVLMSNVVESLTVTYYFGIGGKRVLPRSLLYNTSLRKLELNLRCIFKVPTRIYFPNLKSLKLSRGVDIVNESSSDGTLTLSFPVVETLALNDCQFLNVKSVEIHAPALRKLHRQFPSWATTNDYEIKILSTGLEEFEFSGKLPEKFVFVGQQVVCATLDYPGMCSHDLQLLREIGLHAQALLNEFSILKELTISASFAEAIMHTGTRISVPMFHHLVRLSVSTNSYRAEGLLELLYAAPFLTFLNICVSVGDRFLYGQVSRVPVCITDALDEVEFKSFDCNLSQLSLVKFILENGRKLKAVHFSGIYLCMKKDELVEQLSTFPKCSACVRFHVT